MRAEWPFTGREAELDLVTAVLDRRRSGDARAGGAVVVAPAGVGKTRLLLEVRRWAEIQGRRTATVIATQAAARTPYGAVLHLLPDGAAHRPDRAAWHAEFASALRSDDRGTVLLVDDAQHLDHGSAALLLQLVLEGVVAPVVAARRGAAVPDPVTSLWKDELCLRVDLQPFSETDMRGLIDRVLDGPVSERTLARLAAVSDGNVLYARELVSAAVEGASLRPRDGLWVWDEQVVLLPRLVDAVWERLETLTHAQRRALALVALGEPLPLAVAESLTTLSVLSSLESDGLVRVAGPDPQGLLRLGHPLYGEVVLDHLGRLGRRQLVASLADGFERTDHVAGEAAVRVVTWRLDSGQSPTPEELLGAAVRANHAFDHELAARLSRATLDALDDGCSVTRTDVAVELARALVGCNQVEEAHALLVSVEDAVLLGTETRLLEAYLDTRFSASYLGLGRAGELHRLLDRLEGVPGSGEPLRSRRLTAYRAGIALGEGRAREGVSMAEPLLDLAELTPTQRLLALRTSGEALSYLGRPSRAEEVWDRMRRHCSEGPGLGPVAAVEADLQALSSALLGGRVLDALPEATALHRRVENSPDVASRGRAGVALGRCLLLLGRLDRARSVLLDAVADLRRVAPGGSLARALALLSQVEGLRLHGSEARRWRDEALDQHRGGGTARQAADLVAAEVWLAVADGDRTAAVTVARDGAARLEQLPLPRAWLLHLACRVGDRSREVAFALRGVADEVECELPALLADHAEALRGDDRHGLEATAERLAERGLRVLAAEAASQAAAAHRTAGSSDGLRRASARAAALGRRFDGVVTPALDDTAAHPALSRREHDVAQLAASGLSNAAIAGRLVVSVRTVESHLYQAFAKLGIDSRNELDRFLPARSAPSDQ